MKPLLIVVVTLISLCNAFAEEKLKVGFANVDVTPKIDKKNPVYLAGFGHNRIATEINDPLMVRTIVLESGGKKIAMACADVVGLFNEVAVEVRSRVKGFDYVMVSSTHNHEGPDTIGLWGPTPFVPGVDPKYMKQLIDGIVQSIETADRLKQETHAEIGLIQVPELLHDNRLPNIKHDDLVVLRFLDATKKKNLGLLVQWNCHPETLGDRNTKVSADYVTWTIKELQETNDCSITYFTGTVGGLMTSLKVPIKDDRGNALNDGTFEKTEKYGRNLAKKVNESLKKVKPIQLTPIEFRSQSLLLPMENKMYQLGWQIGVFKRKAYLWKDDPTGKELIEAKDTSKPLAVRSEIGYLKLGQLEVAIIPGEIYPELVLGKVENPADPAVDFPNAPVEPSIYGQFKGPYKMLIGLGNDELGYFIPRRQWDADAPFAYKREKSQYGEINSIGPSAAPIICEAFQRLVQAK